MIESERQSTKKPASYKGNTLEERGVGKLRTRFSKFVKRYSLNALDSLSREYLFFQDIRKDMGKELLEIEKEFIESIDGDEYKEYIGELLHKAFSKYLKDSINLMQTLSVVLEDPRIKENEKKFIQKLYLASYAKASINLRSFMEDYKELNKKDAGSLSKEGLIEYKEMYGITENEIKKILKFYEENEEFKEVFEERKEDLKFYLANSDKYIPLSYSKDSFKLYFSSMLLFAYNYFNSESKKHERQEAMEKIIETVRSVKAFEIMFFPSVSGVQGVFSYLNEMAGIEDMREAESELNRNLIEEDVSEILFRIAKNSGSFVPIKNGTFLARMVFDEIRKNIEDKIGAKVGTLESLNNSEEIKKLITTDFALRVMQKKQISPDSSVVGEQDSIEFPGKMRSFHGGISSKIPGRNRERMLKYIKDIIELIYSNNVIFESISKAGPAATNGDMIWVNPLISYSNTIELNIAMLYKFLTHENNHIKLGTFRIEEDKEDGKRIFISLKKIKDILEKNLDKEDLEGENSVLLKFIEESIARFNEEMTRKFDFSDATKIPITQEDLFQKLYDIMYDLIQENLDYKASEKIKKFYRGYLKLSNDIINIFEDRKIDHYYEVNERDSEKAAMYRSNKIQLMYSSIESLKKHYKNKALEAMEEEEEDEKEKNAEKQVSKIMLSLLYTKMEEAFQRFYEIKSEEKNLVKYIKILKDITKDIDEESKKPIYELTLNKALQHSITYFAAMVILGDIELPEQKTKAKGEGEEGGKGGSQSGEPENEDNETEDSGISIKDPWEEENEGELDFSENNEAHKKGKMQRREKQEEIEGQIETNKGTQYRVVVSRKDIMYYEEIFKRISSGKIKEKLTYGKTGELDTDKLPDFIQTGNQNIFKSRDVVVKHGRGPLFPKDINIYVAVDTSISMTKDRVEKSLKEIMTMFAAYKNLRTRKSSSNINVNLRLVSISDDKVVGVWDVNDFGFEKRGNSTEVSFNFHTQGGGTDLPKMMASFIEVIKKQRRDADKSIIKGRPVDYPSYLIMAFTDFGDNAGDVDGFKQAIVQLGKFAEEYNRKSAPLSSKSIGNAKGNAGVALMFIGPGVDSNEIKKVAERNVEDGVVIFQSSENSKRVAEKMEKLLSVLNGRKASNIKTNS